MGEHFTPEAAVAKQVSGKKKGVVDRFKKEIAAVAGALALGAASEAKANTFDFDPNDKNAVVSGNESDDEGAFDGGSLERTMKGLNREEVKDVEKRAKTAEIDVVKAEKALGAFYDKKVSYEKALKQLEDSVPVHSKFTLNNGLVVERGTKDIYINGVKITPQIRAQVVR